MTEIGSDSDPICVHQTTVMRDAETSIVHHLADERVIEGARSGLHT